MIATRKVYDPEANQLDKEEIEQALSAGVGSQGGSEKGGQ